MVGLKKEWKMYKLNSLLLYCLRLTCLLTQRIQGSATSSHIELAPFCACVGEESWLGFLLCLSILDIPLIRLVTEGPKNYNKQDRRSFNQESSMNENDKTILL